MSRLDPQQGLMPSILDRLIDPESGGTAWRRGYGVEQMVDAVRRDLEDLLNTRQTSLDVPEAFHEVRHSLIAFGLPDLTSLNAITQQQREEIGRVIETAVSLFEPRLKDVKATMIDPGDGKDHSVKFRVDAKLKVDPAPEVAFDTILELTSGQTQVKESG